MPMDRPSPAHRHPDQAVRRDRVDRWGDDAEGCSVQPTMSGAFVEDHMRVAVAPPGDRFGAVPPVQREAKSGEQVGSGRVAGSGT